MKPEYHLREAQIMVNFWGTNRCLLGINVDNESPGCTVGREIFTSNIVSREGNRVETQNSVYIVDSWYVDPDAEPVAVVN